MAKRADVKRAGIGHHMERIGPRLKLPIMLVFAAVIVIIALFVLGVRLPFGQEQGGDIVDQKIVKYVELYLGFVNVTVTNRTLVDDVWTVSLLAHAPDGLVSLDVWMNANDFSIAKIYQSIDLPIKPNTIIFLDKSGCSVGDRITTDIYIDPYDPWSRKYDTLISGLVSKFGDKLRVTYRIVPTYSYDAIQNDANSDAVYAMRYLECAKGTPYFEGVKRCVYDKYGETQAFLPELEMIACAGKAGMNTTDAFDCANGDKALSELSVDERFAETFLGSPTTPAMVFDCRYETFPLFVDGAFCYLYPDIDGCKAQ
ncbi:Uncharacterised protein [uncultured archaeon]|nr:Uncharacterised protein [uncultured archaeon]